MNSVKGEMALIGKSSRIMKSMRGIKSTRESKPISQAEWSGFFLKNEKEEAVNRSMMIR
jgi:hypothetical protein